MRPVFVTNLEQDVLGQGHLKVSFGKHAIGQLPSVHDVEDYDWSTHHDQEVAYVIDVHFRYDRAEGPLKLQEQGGVDVYRHLLAHYTSRELPVRVAFYSPIARENLVRLMPENYVLLHQPFIKGSYSEAFGAELDEIVAQEGWPQFNNASENLLSGWALANKEQIRVGVPPATLQSDGRKVVVVDDEMLQWKATLTEILGPEGLTLLHYDKSIGTRGEFALEKLGPDPETALRSADLILSDLYLEERHETTRWMSGEQLQDISGFKLFDLVKGTEDEKGWNPGAPYFLHTSSNKVNYYRHFHEHGLDSWLVKDLRPDAPAAEKLAEFDLLREQMEAFTTGRISGLYTRMRHCWSRIMKIHSDPLHCWWYASCDERQEEVLTTLKVTWFGLREFLARRGSYQYRMGGTVDIHTTPAALVNSLGRLAEAIRFPSYCRNYVFYALRSVRNCSAHWSNSRYIVDEDVMLMLEAWTTILGLDSANLKNSLVAKKGYAHDYFITERSYYDQRRGTRSVHLFNQLLLTYLQLINYEPRQDIDFLRIALRKRCHELLLTADVGELWKDIVNQHPPSHLNARLAPLVAPSLAANGSGSLRLVEDEALAKLYITAI